MSWMRQTLKTEGRIPGYWEVLGWLVDQTEISIRSAQGLAAFAVEKFDPDWTWANRHDYTRPEPALTVTDILREASVVPSEEMIRKRNERRFNEDVRRSLGGIDDLFD